MPALHSVVPAGVVAVPEDVVGRDVEVGLDVGLFVLVVEPVDVEVDAAGVGVGGLELHAPVAARAATATSPMHTRPRSPCRMAPP
ncbi:MAG: hypothetical protein ABJA89_12280 [Lapillicoccus sp.]